MSGPHVDPRPLSAVERRNREKAVWVAANPHGDPLTADANVAATWYGLGWSDGARDLEARPRRLNRLGLVAVVAAAAALLIAGVAIGRASAAPRSVQTTTLQPGASGAIGSVDAPSRAAVGTSSGPTGAPLGSRVAVGPYLSVPASAESGAMPSGARSPGVELGTAIEAGTLAFADPGLGDRYLAIPAGPGHRVRICSSAGRCLERTSTDAGPALFEQRAGRIADVSFVDFAWLCGCDPRVVGLVEGSIEWLDGPGLTAPPTDVEP